MSSDSIRSNSLNSADYAGSFTPHPMGGNTNVSPSTREFNDLNTDARTNLSSRLSANRSLEGTTGNVEQNRPFPLHAALLLRKAGRCTHESCAADRARGMELARSAGFQVPNSLPAPIPSIAVEKKYYPEDPRTGKQDRKNVQTYKELRPADPKHPEWLSAKAEMDKHSGGLYLPEDLLAHHHDD